jgi:hypothetical protein
VGGRVTHCQPSHDDAPVGYQSTLGSSSGHSVACSHDRGPTRNRTRAGPGADKSFWNGVMAR